MTAVIEASRMPDGIKYAIANSRPNSFGSSENMCARVHCICKSSAPKRYGAIRTARVIVYIVFGNVVPKRYGAYTYRDPAVDDPALRRLLENICFFSVITFERPRTGRLLASGIRGGFRRRPNHVLGSFDFLLDSLADRGLHLVACLAD